MPTPTEQQARSQHAQQAAIAAAGTAAVAAMAAQSMPWRQVLAKFAAYQLAAAQQVLNAFGLWAGRTPQVNARAFAGVTSRGYSIAEPLIAAIDRKVEAPAEAIPAPWWKPDQVSSFIKDVERVIEAEIKDAARAAATVALVEDGHWQGYVRMLMPPSCKRCAVLAGAIYRWNTGFSRHPPTCDCIHVPLSHQSEYEAKGLIADPQELFQRGLIRDLTHAETRALEEGSSFSQVINASSSMYIASMSDGRRLKATWTGTKRSAWKRNNPGQQIRLRPEAIFQIVDEKHGGSRDEARRLLREYGYLTDASAREAAHVRPDDTVPEITGENLAKILDGRIVVDSNGRSRVVGGHASGKGFLGKTEFPEGSRWNDKKYLYEQIYATMREPDWTDLLGHRRIARRELDGLILEVGWKEGSGAPEFVNAFPVNGDGVTKNTAGGTVQEPLNRQALERYSWRS